MSGFSTGVRGGVDAHAQALGVARLQALERQQAGDLLNGLRAHLGDRDGVLRILHTSSDTKEVKFKSAGSFKRVFISPERLGKAGEAIEHLMRQAGYSDESIEAFSAYRGARGNQGVEVRQVLKHLNLGQPVSAATPEQALDAAGADRAGARELG
ncbi:MAG: hypothetical protein KGR68_19105, partial [Betaproteobacteria bacterium]|nr:hypothetical protein [Betaproteobacteria bacterium]